MSGLRRADLWVAVAAGAVILFVALLPSPRDNNPPIPDTPAHHALPDGRACLGCHGSEGVRPLPARHPPRQDCRRCHREGETGPAHDAARPAGALAWRPRHDRSTEELTRPWKETRRWSR